jgi:hypothetical protein
MPAMGPQEGTGARLARWQHRGKGKGPPQTEWPL